MKETREPLWTPTFIAFLLYVFIIVTYKLGIGTVVMGGALLTLCLQRAPLRVPAFLWLFLLWVVWAALGYLVTPYRDLVWPTLVQQAKLVLVALVAVNALRTPAQVRVFIVVVLASYLLFPVRATILNYLHGYTNLGRAVGPFIYGNSNDLAAITILMLAPALALFAGEPRRGWARWFGVACAVAFVITILLTQSRGAFLALVGLALPSTIALARRRPRLVPVFAGVVVVALYLAPAGLWERVRGMRKATSIETISDMDPEGSARVRFGVLQTAARIIADRPFVGVGLGSYMYANRDYNPSVGMYDTHNTYMNIAAETGLPGLILFGAMLWSVLQSARIAQRRARLLGTPQADIPHWLHLGLIAFMIAAMFGSFSKLAFVYVYLSMLWSSTWMVFPSRVPQHTPVVKPSVHPSLSTDRHVAAM